MRWTSLPAPSRRSRRCSAGRPPRTSPVDRQRSPRAARSARIRNAAVTDGCEPLALSVTPIVEDPPRDYGDKVVAVEPGGVEFIPLDERHGSPVQLLWTWTSPNLEFATVGVGILGPLYFGLSFWQAVAAIVLGTALGGLTQGVLSTWGPGHGLAQMVISRSGFGFLGNALPAGLNAVVAGIGWFAVNSVS